MHDTAARHALVFAIAHEIGNHLAAIRLEANLLDEDHGAVALARSALAIDGLAGRAGPLLALLRPLLEPGTGGGRGIACARVLEGVKRQLDEEGTGGRGIELAIDARAGALPAAIEGLHALLIALVGPPDELPTDAGPIVLGAEAEARGLAIVCELPGQALAGEAALEAAAGAAGVGSSLRGHALALAMARALAAEVGGSVASEARGHRSRAVLRLPRRD